MNLFKLLHLLLTFQSLIPRSETQLNDAIGRGLAKVVSVEPLAISNLFVQREIFSKYFIVPPCVFMDSLFIKKPLYRIAARVSHNVNHPLKSNKVQSKQKMLDEWSYWPFRLQTHIKQKDLIHLKVSLSNVIP